MGKAQRRRLVPHISVQRAEWHDHCGTATADLFEHTSREGDFGTKRRKLSAQADVLTKHDPLGFQQPDPCAPRPHEAAELLERILQHRVRIARFGDGRRQRVDHLQTVLARPRIVQHDDQDAQPEKNLDQGIHANQYMGARRRLVEVDEQQHDRHQPWADFPPAATEQRQPQRRLRRQ